MARRLQNQKRSEYHCPAKSCPAPADLRGLPGIQREVRKEWAARMEFCRSGKARARRVVAKSIWVGKAREEKRSKK